ncbi:hypothetical protein [Bradyrhizobium ottawaense]
MSGKLPVVDQKQAAKPVLIISKNICVPVVEPQRQRAEHQQSADPRACQQQHERRPAGSGRIVL